MQARTAPSTVRTASVRSSAMPQRPRRLVQPGLGEVGTQGLFPGAGGRQLVRVALGDLPGLVVLVRPQGEEDPESGRLLLRRVELGLQVAQI